MHAVASAPVPAHSDEANAILLYAEENVSVQSATNIKTTVRKVYKILRPEGRRDYEYAAAEIGPHKKVSNMRAWCIPVNGRDFQVKDKEAVDIAPDVPGGDLLNDIKIRMIRIPAAEPGSVVGWEYETEEQPMILQDQWLFQHEIPVRETHYSLELPSGWSYVAKWANYPESKPAQNGNRWQWNLSDVKEIRREEDMPPLAGIAGQMIIYFVPPGETAANAFTNWKEMGDWYRVLTNGRTDDSPDLKQMVQKMTASQSTTLGKMQAIAQFAQQNVRYVAIEMGIGGWQPHSAAEAFTHRYGDCKDKTTVTISMLHEIGVESYYLIVNSRRGAVTPDTPPHVGAFNHAVVAILLPKDTADDPSLIATLQPPKYGKLLVFDPTDELTPFGELGSYLQGGFGMLVLPDGGQLIQLPTLPATTNSIKRTAKLTLDGSGTLKGDVVETRLGDKAWTVRARLQSLKGDSDRVRPIENILSNSLANFQITHASIENIKQTNLPFGFNYSFVAPNYAKNAGGLLLVRPRVLGVKAIGIATSKEPRQYSFEFSGVGLETDNFDIAIPAGYTVDDLPEAADADYSFGSYHAKTVVEGSTIHYRRTYEIKQASVPVDEAAKVKKFYQVVANDERNMLVLKPAGQ
jgi:uncharacterized protein DUF3857/transglutaminase superfamily protein